MSQTDSDHTAENGAEKGLACDRIVTCTPYSVYYVIGAQSLSKLLEMEIQGQA